jgi:hypothetical protein
LSEGVPHGRLTSTQGLLVVQVIVHQRGVVEQLHPGREAHRIRVVDPQCATGVHGQPGSHALATRGEVMASGTLRGGRSMGGLRCTDQSRHQRLNLSKGDLG